MVAELISVGTELLLGDIVNTNAQYLAKQLASLGIEIHYQTVVGDNPERIKSALDIAYSRAQLVVLTGGLGPTKDDMTKEMLMSYFGKTTVLDEKALENVITRVRAFGIDEITDAHRKQALVPSDSIILYNENGTAPGCIMERDGKRCILLPGPPREMKPMFEGETCQHYLHSISNQVLVSMCIKTYSKDERPGDRIGEAPVAERLDELLDSENPTVATYAKEDGCLVRVTALAKSRERALALIQPTLEECKKRIGEDVIKYVAEQER